MRLVVIKEECPSCEGAGVYVGLAERDGAAVVCSKCGGTGCFKFSHSYKPFTGRKVRKGVTRVFERNVGLVFAEEDGYTLSDWGGVSYDEWREGAAFRPGREDRVRTCPAWYYWVVDRDKAPKWIPCRIPMERQSYKECRYFPCKHECWQKWDKEVAHDN